MSEQDARRSTARSRQLGGELKGKRVTAGWPSGRLAERLGWSIAKVSKLEAGVRGVSDTDVAAYLTVCGVKGAEFARLVSLSRESGRDVWVRPSGALRVEEARATGVVEYQCMVVPRLLRTAEYARAVGGEAIGEAAKGTFFLEEQVLSRPVGGREVMHDQLMHLLLSPAVVRVVPTGAGGHAGVKGSFAVLENAEGAVVRLEGLVADVFLEGVGHVAEYRVALEEVAAVALSVEGSREVLGRAADGCGWVG
ncbi:helix-turn-helix transcriptional regulator [Umezawaea sp. Da 62-37]|uniref:helix-turn-helix domain-containing protein n=1 Tax=Umezawaea sp. Da 62-37 TaxID=3075927 RepID=UPI0028F71567|nr:helix-turn-helix transcriptional regulator [Umezawaea sp. Da 62-37]WNV86487.1 helix-turn-helix transcriptional regulator [Umezawaea sp. Da 62-37]